MDAALAPAPAPGSGAQDEQHGAAEGHQAEVPKLPVFRAPVMMLTRVEKFSAAHCLKSSKMTEEENREFFGKCQNIHGHNYTLEATVRGKVQEKTGAVINATELKDVMQKHVIALLDHNNLDTVDFFHDKPSTTENLALFCWLQLDQALSPGLLYEVKLYETDKNIVVFRGEFA